MRDRILLLDGGMGTTLSALGYDTNTPLWGCDLIHTDPAAIRKVYEGFVTAGAELIGTSTYQLTIAETASLGIDESDSMAMMQSAVSLAVEVCEAANSVPGHHRRPGVVLPLGPFGAILSPGQEYDGLYPPPYGPAEGGAASNSMPRTTKPADTQTSPKSLNAFPQDAAGQQAEEDAVEALKQWHIERLHVYSADPEAWAEIEWLAFETIPLLREIRAVRRAIAELREELHQRFGATAPRAVGGAGSDNREWWDKKFWITSPFPRGQHPQRISQGDTTSGPAPVLTVMDALLAPRPGEARPDGIGLNCTNPADLQPLVNEYTSQLQQRPRANEPRPTLVIYPDGGTVYDPETRTWTDRTYSAADWAEHVGSVALAAAEAKQGGTGDFIWGGVIVGGCCNTSFQEIAALRKILDERGRR